METKICPLMSGRFLEKVHANLVFAPSSGYLPALVPCRKDCALYVGAEGAEGNCVFFAIGAELFGIRVELEAKL